MRQNISNYLRGLNIRVVLRDKHYDGIINSWLIDFLGHDNKYYSLLVGYTETEIFCIDDNRSMLLGDGRVNKLYDKLTGALRIFSTKNDWLQGKYDLRLAERFSKYTLSRISTLVSSLAGFTLGAYSVQSASLWVQPFLSITLEYSYNGEYGGTINFVCTSKVIIEDSDINFKNFIDSLSLDKFYEWRGVNDTIGIID